MIRKFSEIKYKPDNLTDAVKDLVERIESKSYVSRWDREAIENTKRLLQNRDR